MGTALIYGAMKREGANTSGPYDRQVMEVFYPFYPLYPFASIHQGIFISIKVFLHAFFFVFWNE